MANKQANLQQQQHACMLKAILHKQYYTRWLLLFTSAAGNQSLVCTLAFTKVSMVCLDVFIHTRANGYTYMNVLVYGRAHLFAMTDYNLGFRALHKQQQSVRHQPTELNQQPTYCVRRRRQC